jgi:hypothetical protein
MGCKWGLSAQQLGEDAYGRLDRDADDADRLRGRALRPVSL